MHKKILKKFFLKTNFKIYNLKIIQPITKMTVISNWLHSFQ